MKFLTHDGLLYFWKKIKNYIDTGLSSKANVSQIPTTLPANGGNADTVDGVHAWQMQTVSNEGGTHGMSHLLTCQYSNSESAFRLKTTEGIAVRTNYSDTAGNANYANSAGSATNATNSNYATSAGNSNTVGGYGVSKGVIAGQYGLRVTQISNYDIGVGAALSTGELYIVYE